MASFRFIGYGFNQSDCSIFGNPPTPFPFSKSGKKICVFPAQNASVQYGCPGVGISTDGAVDGGISHTLKVWITPDGGVEFFWGTFTYGSSSCWEEEEEEKKYDCINGACIEAVKYETPGLYQSLEECQVACGTGCSGKCISSNEWKQIQDLARRIRNKNCS